MAKTKTGPGWKDLNYGFVMNTPGSAREYKTGDWRSERPVVNFDQCIKCGVCYIFCPDMAIAKTDEGYFQADLYYCKGCGICSAECFTGCITMIPEED